MEKRLFLAVLLSLGVVFVFQAFFKPKQMPEAVSKSVHQSTAYPESQSSSGHDLNDQDARAGTADDANPAATIKEDLTSAQVGPFLFQVSNIGGQIKKVELTDQKYVLPIQGIAEIGLFNDKTFTSNQIDKNTLLLSHDSADWAVIKSIKVHGYQILVDYKITNKTNALKSVELQAKPFEIDLSRLDNKEIKSEWTLFEYAFRSESKISRKEQVNNFSEKWNKSEDKKIEWISFRDRYFAVVVAPENEFKGFSTKVLGDKNLTFHAIENPVTIAAGAVIERKYTVYAGPQRLDLLKEARPGFEKVLVFSSWGWLDAIAKIIYWLLGALHKVLPSWGLCIILVSLIVYGVMYPLTLKSMISMKKMQAVQPKMAQLKEKYKNSPEKLNKEVVELYRVEGINPLSGCLPLVLQMPIFVGLYQVLWRSIYFRGEGFLWIKDLSMPDRLYHLPFEIPFLGSFFNILPFLMMGIMFVQQTLTMKSMAGGDPEQVAQQKMMATLMPVVLGVVFYNFSSGLNLYFVVFYSMSAISQWYIGKTVKAGS